VAVKTVLWWNLPEKCSVSARVHQYGLKDRPNAHAQDVQYAERQLLGFSQADKQLVETLTIKHLSR
jgi:phage virion morphogenesis protein